MSRIFQPLQVLGVAAVLALSAVPALASNFSMAIGPRNELVISGPDGKEIASLNAPSVSQPITAGPVSVQVSYGRDINDLLTAIVAPNPATPKSVTFTVNGNTISADRTSYVTVSFAPNFKDIAVDPGFVGAVSVNGKRISRTFATNGFRQGPVPSVRTVSTKPAPPSAAPSTTSMPAPNKSASKPSVPPSYATTKAPARRSHHSSGSSAPQKHSTPASMAQPTAQTAATTSSKQDFNPNDPRIKIPGFPMMIGGIGVDESTTANAGSTSAPQTGSYYMPPNPRPQLQSKALTSDPNTKIVPITDYQSTGPRQMKLLNGSARASAGSPNVNLQTKSPWSEPITPPSGNVPKIGASQIKLMEIQGPVMVQKPGSTDLSPATEGMMVPTGTKVVTQNGGSAAALMGGVNSVRFGPDSEGTLNQDVKNKKRTTTIDLKKGLVFSKVGRKTGETQDFKVKTPSGVAAAKGTDFATWAAAPFAVISVAGQVFIFDNSDNFLGEANAKTNGSPAIFTVPDVSDSEKQKLLKKTLDIANQFNLKTNEILNKQARGEALTPAERAFIDRSPGVSFLVNVQNVPGGQFYDYSLVPTPFAPELAPGDSINNWLIALERNVLQFFPLNTPGAEIVLLPPPTTPF